MQHLMLRTPYAKLGTIVWSSMVTTYGVLRAMEYRGKQRKGMMRSTVRDRCQSCESTWQGQQHTYIQHMYSVQRSIQ